MSHRHSFLNSVLIVHGIVNLIGYDRKVGAMEAYAQAEMERKLLTRLGWKGEPFTQASLTHTSLTHTSLTNTSLTHTSLTHTSLTHTSLTHTSLTHTSLTHTSLTHTSLTHTSLTHTSLHTRVSHKSRSVAQTLLFETRAHVTLWHSPYTSHRHLVLFAVDLGRS